MTGLRNAISRGLFIVLLQLSILTAVQSAVVADDPGSRYRCHDQGQLHRGSRRIYQGGAYILYRCDVGFSMLGSNLVRCLPTGRWNLPKPLCIGSGCANTEKIDNGSEKAIYGGNIIRYQCHSGYVLRGSSTIYCDGEHWNDTVPECLGTGVTSFAPVSRCPDLGEVRNAVREVYENDGAVIYRCNVGYDIIGSPAVRCQYNGEWTTPKPVCSRDGCDPLPEIRNGYKQILHRGRVTQYKCYSDYKLRGSTFIYCDGRQWNDTAPHCVQPGQETTTDDPTVGPGFTESEISGDVDNLRIEGGTSCSSSTKQPNAGHRYGRKVDSYGNLYYVIIYQCQGGYKLIEGELELYCRNGEWVGQLPVCGPVDPCETNNGGCEHRCQIGDNGRAKCVCSHGYQLIDQRRCIDINECLDNDGHGPCSHICINRKAGFMCTCPQGYKLLSNRLTCEVVLDPCQENNGGCSHECTNVNRHAQCSCPTGYRIGYDRKTCQDVNECAERRAYCYNGGCENTPGSFRCVCNTGFYMASNGHCTDMNECTVNNGECSHECRNSWGSYSCRCPRGYELSEDRHTCQDVNECSNPYYYRQCPYGCENTPGSFHCLCPSGFTASNGINCVDIDECEQNSGRGPCQGKCVNKPGSYACVCDQSGYKLAADGHNCEDIDECQVEDTCHHNCHNLPGGYQCTCNHGFLILPDKKTCEGCRQNSYKSTRANECIECPPNSHTEGLAKTALSDCICNTGFHGDLSEDLTCEDINECETDNYGCFDHCVNTPGGAFCACSVGFRLEEGKVCVDIDECSQNNGGCEQKCQNTEGSFSCSCKDGYTVNPEDPYVCTDINECEHNNGGCDQRCVNFPGGYLCECDDQSIMAEDRTNCESVVCSALAVPPRGKVRPRGICTGENPNKALVVGSVCTFECLKGYLLEGSEKRICENTGRWSGSEATCKPVRCPMVTPPEFGKVLPNSCENTQSQYQTQCIFTCNEGYALVGNRVTKCQHDRTWSKESPTCVRDHGEPTITCPSELTFDLAPGAAFIITSIPSPVANVNTIHVNRATQDATFYPGTTKVHYAALSDDGTKKATCTVDVHVLDKEAPTVEKCPKSFRIETGERYPSEVNWEEPIFTDNVGIIEEWNSRDPGGAFTWGVYNVVYFVRDAANNVAECTFVIEIEPKSCGLPEGPLNGESDCVDWLFGKICDPVCHEGYTFYGGRLRTLYMCGANATWSPSSKAPDCTEYTSVASGDVECPAGAELVTTYSDLHGPACVKCPRGMFLEKDSKKCTPCSIGYYQDEFGKTKCKRCPRRFSTTEEGRISQEDCTESILDEEYSEDDTSGDSQFEMTVAMETK
ncbi:uncharacterized protein LOC144438649 [Glandiceps talaboti]